MQIFSNQKCKYMRKKNVDRSKNSHAGLIIYSEMGQRNTILTVKKNQREITRIVISFYKDEWKRITRLIIKTTCVIQIFLR